MNNNLQQLMEERLKEIPLELRTYLSSVEVYRKIQLVAKKYQLNDDQERILQNITIFVLMVTESVEALPERFADEMDISSEKANNLAKDIEEYVLQKVRNYLAENERDLISDDTGTEVEESQTKASQQLQQPLQPSSSLQPQPTIEALTKATILSEIENPPRTVIKRYVLEHEPITDPEHLIDDSIDERPRLGS